MNTNTIDTLAEKAVLEATNGDKVLRNKAYKLAFDRAEKEGPLSDSIKKGIRDAINKLIDSHFQLEKKEHVVTMDKYVKLSSAGEVIRGRTFRTENETVLSEEDEILLLRDKLFVLKLKVGKQENGPSIAQMQNIRKLSNAIKSRLFNIQNPTDEMLQVKSQVLKWDGQIAQTEVQSPVMNKEA